MKGKPIHTHALAVLLGTGLVHGNLSAGEPLATGDGKTPQAEPPAEEAATLYPVPDYSGDLLTRPALTGDWGGTRTAIAENGIQFEFAVNQFYQGLVDGGRQRVSSSWQYSGTADYTLKLDTGKAGLWPGGFLEVHGQTFFGDPAGLGAGNLLPTNVNYALSSPYGDGTYLPHITMVQFLNEKFALVGGKINTAVGDPNAFTPGGLGLESFMNMSFAFNPVTVHVSPYSTLAGGFLYMPNEKVTLGFTMFDSDGNMEDTGFDTIFNGNTTYVGQAQVKTEFFDKPGTQRLLFMASTKEYTTLDQDPRFLLPVADIAPQTDDDSWNASWNFDQYLTDSWGVFGRIGVSDGEVNLIEQFYSAGIGGTGIIPGRENDRFGVGWFYAGLSDSFAGRVLDNNEQGVEIFYDIAVTPWFRLAADAQFIKPALKTADTATVLGLRGVITF